jgi:hypothetical protein
VRRCLVLVLCFFASCGSRTQLVVPERTFDGGTDAGRDAGVDAGRDAGRDAGMDAGRCEDWLEPAVLAGTPLGESCTDTGSAGFDIEARGCLTVEISPVFIDVTDASGGQPAEFRISDETGCFTVKWDDCPSDCDCDLDIEHEVCVEAERTCAALTVRVTNTILAYEAGNHVEAGYSITGNGAPMLMSGSETRTFVYHCEG